MVFDKIVIGPCKVSNGSVVHGDTFLSNALLAPGEEFGPLKGQVGNYNTIEANFEYDDKSGSIYVSSEAFCNTGDQAENCINVTETTTQCYNDDDNSPGVWVKKKRIRCCLVTEVLQRDFLFICD
mmetsp:Transcript_18071/g.20831  ORF Transcript_18071/g.20831 Transcript_18071/m.20831 type:complete len:125 (+) Transcript_18071:3-377(+)